MSFAGKNVTDNKGVEPRITHVIIACNWKH